MKAQTEIRHQNGAATVVAALEELGVELVAGMPGGAILPIYDALYHSELRHILVRHEQAAGFIASGYARASGKVGVCLATSGPGATNLLTALADAFADSIPLVAITGQVPTALRGTNAFQEVDICAMARPHLRAALAIEDASQIETTIVRAFAIASGPRPGPVLVDIPKDIQLAAAEASTARTANEMGRSPYGTGTPDPGIIREIQWLLEAAQQPIVYFGGGIIHSGASEELRRFVHRQQIPAVATLMGLGAIDGDDSLFLGMLGMHGARSTNLALQQCDLLFAIGARFDDRAVGRARDFCPQAKIVHIDIDSAEFGKIRRPDVSLQADAGLALATLDCEPEKLILATRRKWLDRIANLRSAHPVVSDCPNGAAIALIRALRDHCADDILTTDVGQHQMWLAQYFSVHWPRQLLTSGGLGAMGFGLPAAIGAALAAPQRRVVCLSGDGSILLNIQELVTLAELDLAVKIIVLDNRHLGLVRQQQELFFDGRNSECAFPISPDLVAVARAFGIAGEALELRGSIPGHLSAQLGAFLEQPGPALLHVMIPAAEMVLPMVPPGAANDEMLGAGRGRGVSAQHTSEVDSL